MEFHDFVLGVGWVTLSLLALGGVALVVTAIFELLSSGYTNGGDYL